MNISIVVQLPFGSTLSNVRNGAVTHVTCDPNGGTTVVIAEHDTYASDGFGCQIDNNVISVVNESAVEFAAKTAAKKWAV